MAATMPKLYHIKPERDAEWKAKLPEEKYQRFTTEGFIVDDIVELCKEWDMALQRILDQVVIVGEV